MNNPPVGVELDAAVLRILGWSPSHDSFWKKDGECYFLLGESKLSTDPNGHEALRLCGPWLREHTLRWGISQTNDGKTYAFGAVKHWAAHVNDVDGIGKAICDLVLAVAEREGT